MGKQHLKAIHLNLTVALKENPCKIKAYLTCLIVLTESSSPTAQVYTFSSPKLELALRCCININTRSSQSPGMIGDQKYRQHL